MTSFEPTREHYELATRALIAALDPNAGRSIGPLIEDVQQAGWVPCWLALMDRGGGLAVAAVEVGDPKLSRVEAAAVALAQLRMALARSQIDGEREQTG